jgi:hypothetical protein
MLMKEKRFWFGIAVTVSWLAFAAYMLESNKRPDHLNLWGDFFSGFFAPLAFLWLVLGYLQQGEELKHSTEALRLQAEELRNSVEQQSQLVAITREQMKHEFEALQEERERRRDAARPKFVPQQSGSITSSGNVTYRIKLVNVGNTATKFRLSFEPPIESPSHHNMALVARDDIISLELRFAVAAPSTAVVRYIDADGFPGEVRFGVQAPLAGGLRLGDVDRIL